MVDINNNTVIVIFEYLEERQCCGVVYCVEANIPGLQDRESRERSD